MNGMSVAVCAKDIHYGSLVLPFAIEVRIYPQSADTI